MVLGNSCGKALEVRETSEGLPVHSPSIGNGSVVVRSHFSTSWGSESQPEVSPYSLGDERQQKGAEHRSPTHRLLVLGVHIGGKGREAGVGMLNSSDLEVGREEDRLDSGKAFVEVCPWQWA